ncbi:MAG: hypothetical protein K9H61_12915 [Bacteroidia bacterium]|nr:hypothetical protein [Bacteroidia bacterium]MCF8447884.1 hypothetical protein [Bacteroidia bacterium]
MIEDFKRKLVKLYANFLIYFSEYRNQKILEKVRSKNPIRVLFLLVNVDTWKYGELYERLNANPRFEVKVVICPFVNKGREFLEMEYQQSLDFCQKKGYHYIHGFDFTTNKSLPVKKQFKPHLVCFQNPSLISLWEFSIYGFLDCLTLYVPYSFRIDNLYEYAFNNDLTNLTWLNVYETKMHLAMAQKYARNKGINVKALGFPHLDSFRKVELSSPWKPQNNPKKKIIWAPHWTIKGFQDTGLDWSCFLDFAELFLQIAKDNESQLQFAFKPHPFLKPTLEKENCWGLEKTNAYYETWNALSNGQVIEGDYVPFFNESDALIHDGGSFMVEYLLQNKPVAYTFKDRNPIDKFNEFGELAFNVHHHISNEAELKSFIKMVLANQAPLAKLRQELVNEELNTNGLLVSEKIENYLMSVLK